ncbi:unnamed protein product, partial [Ixodes hexagonus]
MVRVRVPHVRPIVCCTVKRAVRLLPSALLLVFVLSLILVTLVQIAVIHSHRRALYLQRRVQTTSRPSSAGVVAGSPSAWSSPAGQPVAAQGDGSPTSHFQAWSAAHKAREARRRPGPPHPNHNKSAKGRPNALQVEALLDKNAPSVDNNIKILTGLANAARIRDIFGVLAAAASNLSSNAVGARQATAGTTTTATTTASSNGSLWELVTDVYDGNVLWGDPRRTPKLSTASSSPTSRPLWNDALFMGDARSSASDDTDNTKKADMTASCRPTTMTTTTFSPTTMAVAATPCGRKNTTAPKAIAKAVRKVARLSLVRPCPGILGSISGCAPSDLDQHRTGTPFEWAGAAAFSGV